MRTAATRSRTDATKATLVPLVALTALGAALRFATLGAQSYWNDEAVTAKLLHQGFAEMVRAIPGSESTPPLYYVLAWLWTQAFGLGEVGLRSMSALVGTLTIPVAWFIATRVGSARAGLIAAALVASNPLLWWYSQEARSYALLVLLTAAAVAAFIEFMQHERGLRIWALLAALALATHYFALFIVLPQGVWLAWRAWRTRRGDALGALAFVTLAACALLPLAITQASNQGAKFIASSGSLGFRLAQVPKQFLVGFDAPNERWVALMAAAAALTGAALAITRTDACERRGCAMVVAVAAVGVGLPVLAAVIGADFVITRNLIPALLPALVALAVGFAARSAGVLGIAPSVLLCLLSFATIIGVSRDAAYQRDDWRGVARELGPAVRDRVLVVTPADGGVALEWYLPSARRTGAAVTAAEIDTVAVGRRRAGQKPQPPRGPDMVPNGFSVARRVERPTFTVVSLRAGAPVTIDYTFANEQRLARELRAAVLYQPSGAGRR